MDNVQKAGMVGVSIMIGIVGILIFTSIDWSEIGPIVNTATGRCDEWSDEIEMTRADLNGRQSSLGGQLDLDGQMASSWNQLNLEVDRYNLECAGEETNYYEENLS